MVRFPYMKNGSLVNHENLTLSDVERQFSMWKGQYGRFLPKDRSAKILDVGCGYGGVVHWLHSKGYSFTEGVDLNREKIALGHQLEITHLHHGDAMSYLRGKDRSYDVIFIMDVLSEMNSEEVRELLSVVYVSLKEGGVCIIKSANAESPMAGRVQYGLFGRGVQITEHTLKLLLERAGFSKVAAYPLRPVVHGVVSFIRYCIWFFIEGILKFYRVIETGSRRGVFTQSLIAVAWKK